MPGPITYYPSARVRLLLRIEDYGAPGSAKPPKRPQPNRRGTKDSASTQDSRVVLRNGAYVLEGPGLRPGETGGPHSQTTSTDGLTHVVDGIIPLTADHDRNGVRVADTLKVQIQFVDLPVDIRVFRSIGVEYFLGCVPADEWDRGVSGEARNDATAQGLALPYNVVPDAFADAQGRRRSNLRFQGWVDEDGIGFPKDNASVIELTCTDNTRLLMEQEAPPALTVDPKERIDKAIADYLAAFPQMRGMQVEYRPAVEDSKVPRLADALARGAYPPKLGPTPTGTGKLNVLDYLTDVCGAIGHIVFVQGIAIVIQRPRTLYAAGQARRPDDPFTGRQFPDGTVLRNRTWVYGSNMLEFEMRRKMTKLQPQNIEVRSYLPQRKKTLVVRYPAKDDRQTARLPGDNAEQKYLVKYVRGISDPGTLQVVAQAYYESLGRQEVEATVLSRNLSSLGGTEVDPDALDLEPGDSVDVVTAPPGEDGGNTVVVVASESAAAQRLVDSGFSEEFAAAYAQAYSNIGFPHTYFTRAVSSRWDNQDGLEVQMNVINYVEVRADAQLPSGDEITADDVANAPAIQPVVVEDQPETPT